MHGRVKVKTTAEQQEAKRIEREKKLKIYAAATSKVFKKRKEKEYDSEALLLTGEILSANSDFMTLWNFRREVFQHFKSEKSEDDFQKLCSDELHFLEACLQKNPKGYGAWHHRGWIMNTIPKPDWRRELQLCSQFLEYDERNFHCWDYRRFVVKSSDVSHKAELEFTTEKISTNFSNFSSWHYRSKLLPLIHPDSQNWSGIKEETLLEELELVQNAFFTDPNDQSSWFYHRWLLGTGKQHVEILAMKVDMNTGEVLICLSEAIQIQVETKLNLSICNQSPLLGLTWSSPDGKQFSQIWTSKILPADLQKDNCHVSLQLEYGTQCLSATCILEGDFPTATWSKVKEKSSNSFRSELSLSTSNILEQELDNCQQLHEMEPDNKWVLLTILSLIRALDPVKHIQQTANYIEKLKIVDPLRSNYYDDLRSKFVIEDALVAMDHNSTSLFLVGLKLTTVSHLDHMMLVTKLDLSGNRLHDLFNTHLLQSLETLHLDENNLSNCDSLHGLKRLVHLSLAHNRISNIKGLQDCTSLETVNLKGNPIATEGIKVLEYYLPKVYFKL